MGIVVTVAQVLGLIAFCLAFFARRSGGIQSLSGLKRRFVAYLAIPSLALMGLWNIFWHGMANVDEFWGQAAIISGVIMLLAALDLTERRVLLPRFAVFIALLGVFSLYAITLVRLNMGLPIIG